jgi:bifunctional enzyme CysN/CysC
VLLVDAAKGILTQTRRHAYITTLLGIRHLVLAVNKMDLVDYDQATFDEDRTPTSALCRRDRGRRGDLHPMSALAGCNVTERGPETPWYNGPTLLEHLETVDITSAETGCSHRPACRCNGCAAPNRPSAASPA